MMYREERRKGGYERDDLLDGRSQGRRPLVRVAPWAIPSLGRTEKKDGWPHQHPWDADRGGWMSGTPKTRSALNHFHYLLYYYYWQKKVKFALCTGDATAKALAFGDYHGTI